MGVMREGIPFHILDTNLFVASMLAGMLFMADEARRDFPQKTDERTTHHVSVGGCKFLLQPNTP